jgi:hypothetical protein
MGAEMTTTVRISTGDLAQTLLCRVVTAGRQKGDLVQIPPGAASEVMISGVDVLEVVEASSTVGLKP